jgi:hypothetical protein
LLLALVLAAMSVMQTRSPRDDQDAQETVGVQPATSGEPTGETVSLEIDFGDQRERQSRAVAWRKGMTVADLLAAAQQREGGSPPLEFVVRGRGPSAFLTEIGGFANQGADGANWTYSVNGKRADRSFAIYQLEPGDRVLWSFAPRK